MRMENQTGHAITARKVAENAVFLNLLLKTHPNYRFLALGPVKPLPFSNIESHLKIRLYLRND